MSIGVIIIVAIIGTLIAKHRSRPFTPYIQQPAGGGMYQQYYGPQGGPQPYGQTAPGPYGPQQGGYAPPNGPPPSSYAPPSGPPPNQYEPPSGPPPSGTQQSYAPPSGPPPGKASEAASGEGAPPTYPPPSYPPPS